MMMSIPMRRSMSIARALMGGEGAIGAPVGALVRIMMPSMRGK